MSTIAITVCLLIIFLFHRVLLFRRKLKVVVILLVRYIHPMARKRYPLCQYSALLQYLHLPLKLLGSLCRRTIRRSCSSPPFCLVKVHSARETVQLYHEMVRCEGWTSQTSIHLDNVSQWMSKNDDDHAEGMSIGTTLALVVQGTIIRQVVPQWAYRLPIRRLREVDEAYTRMTAFMQSLVADKKAEAVTVEGNDTSPNDLFSRLIQASESEGKNGLTDKELISNVFIFLFAGHGTSLFNPEKRQRSLMQSADTTAHVLTTTLALLALHEDEQEKAVEAIHEALPDFRNPGQNDDCHQTFDDFDALKKVLACFLEAARLFPPVSGILRVSGSTIALRQKGDYQPLFIPPGIKVNVDTIGILYNPKYFPDPERYDPSRWYGENSELDFTFFGIGPRACIGRKFALTEAVCLLHGETGEMWRQRVMQIKFLGLTLGVPDVPLIMTKRTTA
ncbi:hypothetical protein IEO21_02957 [Rhodonia placenta]|uniref:Cytochrome P450 n=1 Tax=Rhodonia placenta TaxID=104341 RepID=A0A8H7P764_9APHY|nr:hypothetical protein IEO21_02957 [Postia placenta]